ncbi:hypothetical protein L8R85_23835 [Vibrio splendidus]|uniref:Uncharacterized protein n=2 Tax=Vibrio TaxID=662 RepID=A0AA43K0T7_VIBSP|nr:MULTISPECIES: hypothetical protein [Vibrio]MDH5924048.1 hypothetical protein [Vibrio splendidus]MDH5939404.1 hypothetical protein [Vibrio splendidus]MDP2503930.1 hypothetical protein [Vibrio splendidus]MDP2592374.1 hypothetical protein [Vibrio splendidus]NOH77863.1 hypothetical protein [Vibrio crassostreae]
MINIDNLLEKVGEVQVTCKTAYQLKGSKSPQVLHALKARGYVEQIVVLTTGKELRLWVQAN